MLNRLSYPLRLVKAFINPDFNLHSDSETAGRLRYIQLSTLTATTPLMMLVNIINSSVVVAFLYGQAHTVVLIAWFMAVWCLAGLGLNHWLYRRRENAKRDKSSKAAIWSACKAAAILAMIWSAAPLLFYGDIDAQSKLILIAVISGMIGGGVITMYVIPQAMFAWVATIAIGGGLGLFIHGSVHELGIIVLLLVYCTALLRSGSVMAKTFATSEISRFDLSEKSETIDLLLKDFAENASDWLWEADSQGRLTNGQAEFEDNLGVKLNSLDPEENQNNSIADIGACQINTRLLNSLYRRFQCQESFRDLEIMSNSSEQRNWLSLSGKPLFDSDGNFTGYRGVGSNITEAKLSEERIAFLAHNDALTGLINRSHFSKALEEQISMGSSASFWAVMYLDLDGFKSINDTLGHNAGDELLTLVAARLKSAVKETDLVARLGGDEFAILIKSAGGVQSVSSIAERLITLVSQPFNLAGSTRKISVSIGITIGQKDGLDIQTILNNADLALYRAKEEGKSTFRFYELKMDAVVKEKRQLEYDLREAIANNQLKLAFQPLVSSEIGKTTGFEALARWQHPERGNIPPSDFIPIAESLGIIQEIGDWVLKNACRIATNWPPHLTVAVNLSPQQFIGGQIITSVKNAIAESGIKPSRLELEITEGLFMENTEEVIEILKQLKEMDVSIAMDDFGTGYSSLSYLLKFPFDKLKIDRSFVSSINEDEIAKNVLQAIARLGSILNLNVTAEGVETIEQVNALKSMDCTHFQGFLFGKPLIEDDLSAYLLNEFATSNKDKPLQHSDTEEFKVAEAI